MTNHRPTRSPALALTATTLVVLFATALQTQASRGPVLVRVATAQAIASRVDGWPLVVRIPVFRGDHGGVFGCEVASGLPALHSGRTTRPLRGCVETIGLCQLDLPPPARLS